MKKKVGKLYNKPIVVGDPNEFTKNEIALSELGNNKVDITAEWCIIDNVNNDHPTEGNKILYDRLLYFYNKGISEFGFFEDEVSYATVIVGYLNYSVYTSFVTKIEEYRQEEGVIVFKTQDITFYAHEDGSLEVI